MVMPRPSPLSTLYSTGWRRVRGVFARNALMKNASGEIAHSARPNQESNGSVPLARCMTECRLMTDNQPTKTLMNTDLSKFNVVNSLLTCENTGTDSRGRVSMSIAPG